LIKSVLPPLLLIVLPVSGNEGPRKIKDRSISLLSLSEIQSKEIALLIFDMMYTILILTVFFKIII